jgi:hypothetical protein
VEEMRQRGIQGLQTEPFALEGRKAGKELLIPLSFSCLPAFQIPLLFAGA